MGGIEDYNNNYRKSRDNNIQNFNANKAIATKCLADNLGVGYLIPNTYYVKFKIDDIEKIGFFVEPAYGVHPDKVLIKGIKPILQKELLELHLLDVLCCHYDHRPGNYFVRLDEADYVCGISAFDNDCSTSFSTSLNIDKQDYIGCIPLVKNMLIQRSFLPVEMVQKINVFTVEGKGLEKYLSKYQLWALKVRLKKLRTAIAISLDKGFCRLLERSEWDEKSLQDEVNKGNTYLGYFIRTYIKKEESFE